MTNNMDLFDFGYERASYYHSREDSPGVDVDGIVIEAIERGLFVPTDCCSVCPLAAEVSAGAQAFIA